MSQSDSQHAAPSDVAPAAKRPARADSSARWRARMVSRLALVLLCGLILLNQVPREIARWYQAAALVANDRGDLEAAMAALDKSLAYDPNQPNVYIQRGRWRLDSQDAEGALADSKLALTVSLQTQEYSPQVQSARELGAEALQRLGRHREAIEECKSIHQEWLRLAEADPSLQVLGRVAIALNNLAYYRARGNLDLEEALQEIEGALAVLGTLQGGSDSDKHNTDLYILLDTRGYIHYRLGNYEQALADLDAAVSGAEQNFQTRLRRLNWQMQLMPDAQTYQYQVTLLRNNLAVIYHHRGLIYQAIGREEAAKRDLDLAVEWGYDPDKGVW